MSSHLNKKYKSSLNNGEILANQNACTTNKDDCCGEYEVTVNGNNITVQDAGGYSFTLPGVLATDAANLFTESLAMTANKVHTTTGYSITFNNAAGVSFILGDTFNKLGFGASTGVSVDADGINLIFAAGNDLELDGASGTAGQFLGSNGDGSAPTWQSKKYVDTFVTGDFVANDLVITAATHGMGTDPMVQVSTGVGPYTVISNETKVISVAANGDITITDALGGFDGKIVVL